MKTISRSISVIIISTLFIILSGLLVIAIGSTTSDIIVMIGLLWIIVGVLRMCVVSLAGDNSHVVVRNFLRTNRIEWSTISRVDVGTHVAGGAPMKAIGIQSTNGAYLTSLATVASRNSREKAMSDLRMLAAAGNPTVVFDDSDL